MDAKRMRLDDNFSLHSERAQRVLDLKIWQNLQISKCIDDNYINRLLESTRTIVNFHDVSQEEDRLNYHFQQQRSLEHEAINSAITSYGLKQTQKNLPIYSDEDSSSDEQLQFQPSTSNSFETSNVDQNSSLEDAAINSAINSYGLRKE